MLTAVLGMDHHEQASPEAVALGIAIQRTNRLRDIHGDAQHRWISISREAQMRSGLPIPGAREALLRDQITRADAFCEAGPAGVGRLLRGRVVGSTSRKLRVGTIALLRPWPTT